LATRVILCVMKWSIRIGRVFGIPLYIHLTFFLFLAWVGFASWQMAGSGSALEDMLLMCTLFACVVLHELGHALTARRYGIPTRDITLLPIGGVARLDRMPDDPKQEFLVAVAGPAVNVVIAGVLLVVARPPDFSFGSLFADWFAGDDSFVGNIIRMNIILVLFNILPAFPMDGGRVLRALLATRLPYNRATHIAATVGQLMALLFGMIGLFYPPFRLLILVALFVWIGAAQESGLVQMRHSLSGIPVSRAMVTEFHVLSPQNTMADAVELTLKGTQRDFPVVDGERVAGVLRQSDMLAALGRRGAHVLVGDVMQTDFQLVESSEMLDAVYRRLAEHRATIAPVSFQGRLVGLVTMDNIGEFLAIQGALGRPRRVF
ncbi:MAG TPA: site-2 protease family protein, partial [Candidatus Krumholzibacteria bacterium]|nr:site-2 protease family protein [Candidatus Krumholzibacteria bacterium]